MDVSEGRKALHHIEARSIHERMLLSLSLRAGFHMHTHPHAQCLHRHTIVVCCCCCSRSGSRSRSRSRSRSHSRPRSHSRSCSCCFVDSTCHQLVMAASSLQELAAMRNLTTCELDKRRHLVTDVRISKRHMASSLLLFSFSLSFSFSFSLLFLFLC